MSVGDFLMTGALVATLCLVVALGWWGANHLEMWVKSFLPSDKPKPIKGVCCECGNYSEKCVADDIRKYTQLFCPHCVPKTNRQE